MNERYLWDKSGEPDREIERLERVLGSLAHRETPLALPEEVAPMPAGEAGPGAGATSPARVPGDVRPVSKLSPPARRARAWRMPALGWAAAAGLLAVLGGVFWLSRLPGDWRATAIAGSPRVGSPAVDGGHAHLGAAETRVVRPGDWLVTDAASSLRITIGKIGLVEVGPNSSVQVRGVRAPDQRMALAHGTLFAAIVAPPRQFSVETPSATAVDLGCAYTLEVDRDGAATLTVLAGWVSFEHERRETFVPAGARCITRAGAGPGTPYFTDAAPGLKNALALLDLAGADVPDSTLAAVLEAARREDAFTLWHLIPRLEGSDRAQVVDRLAVLVPLPEGASRDQALAAYSAMLERWWNQLGFGAAADWRRWRTGAR